MCVVFTDGKKKYRCYHDDLIDDQQIRKKWLKKGSAAWNALKAVVLDKNLLRVFSQLTLFKHTRTLLKYFGAQPTLPAPDVSSSVSASTADDAAGSSTAELQAPESEEQLQALTFTDTSVSTSAGMTGPSTSAPTAIDFPSTPSTSSSYQDRSTAPPIDQVEWSEFLSDSKRTDLVRRGPVPISDTFTFPKKSDGRSFHYTLKNNG
nr:uncharacterized protein LOC129442101 [Misgurnus anguillicaudatus]